MRIAHLLAMVLGVAFLLVMMPARAVVLCVADEIAFQNALDAASNGGVHQDDDVEIRVVVGTYLTGIANVNQEFSLISGHPNAVTVLGGYTPGCSARHIDPALTVFDGGNAMPVFTMVKSSGSLTMDGLTIQRGSSSYLGGGMSVNAGPCSGTCYQGTILLTRLIVQYNHTSFYCGGLFAAARQKQVRVASSLFIHNSAETDYGAACLDGEDGALQFYGNTVADNTTIATTDIVGGLYCITSGSGVCQIYNNILWSNDGAGLWLGSVGNSYLSHNNFGNRGGEDPAGEIASTHLNPRFFDPTHDIYRLAANSPLFGVSPLAIDIPDIYARPHPASGARDLGAFAETIFIDGFEIVQ